MNRFSLFSILTVVLSVATGLSANEKPNVLLILTDNQAYHELSCHGHAIVQTPHIDRLSEEGIDFRNFHAPNFCSPSRGLLLTGRYPLRLGIHNTIGGVSILPKWEVTLADYLKEAGYATGIFGKWHLGMSYPHEPQHRGFDEVFIHGGGGIGQLEDAYGNKHLDARYWHNGELIESEGYSSDVLFDRAMEFIEAKKEEPFFCFVSTPATHAPYQPHPEVMERLKARGIEEGRDASLYSMIENIDDCVGRIMQQVDDLGLRDNTLVILATDQGVSRTNLPLVPDSGFAQTNSHDQKTKVFCMMRYPPLTKQPAANDAITGMVDVFPTVLDLCGVPLPDNIDGRSLRPLLGGAERWEDDRMIIFQCPRGRNREAWKNVSLKTQRFRMKAPESLYDLDNDLVEVSSEFPEVHQRMVADYEAFFNGLPPEEELLSRHVIGPNPTRLNCMDWYQGASPWGQSSLRKTSANGLWAVEVTEPGVYRFELRRYPREADDLAIEAVQASVRVGEVEQKAKLPEGSAAGGFDLELKPGKYDMEAVFTDAKGKRWGSYFVYVSRVGD